MPAPRHIVAACALIRNDKRQIALVKTARRGWELPGGQIELGESLMAGLQREIFEECGLSVEIGGLAQVRSNLSSSIVIFCFRAICVGGQLRPSEETPEVCWASPARARELVRHPALAVGLRHLLDPVAPPRYQACLTEPFRLIEERLL